ncbi:hypothetical protein [Klebsiella phage KpF2]|nr:hypothetical protein [Klebsiella phage KpF2]
MCGYYESRFIRNLIKKPLRSREGFCIIHTYQVINEKEEK